MRKETVVDRTCLMEQQAPRRLAKGGTMPVPNVITRAREQRFQAMEQEKYTPGQQANTGQCGPDACICWSLLEGSSV